MRRWALTVAMICGVAGAGGCGKKAPVDGGDASSPTTGTGEVAAAGDEDGGPSGAADSAEAPEDEAERRRVRLERLAAAEIEGFQRVMGEVRGAFVTLRHVTKTPNAKGNTVTVEVTLGFCDGCSQETVEQLEGRKDVLLAQYGELHAKNAGLVFEIAEVPLSAERSGVATYVRSFVDDGETRAAVHALEVSYVESGASFRLFVYPMAPFPQTAAEHDAAVTDQEMVEAAGALFRGLAPILWAPN